MRSIRYPKSVLAAVTCAMVVLPAGAAFAGSGPGDPSSQKLARTTAPSAEGNPASKLAKAAGVCDDAVAIGTRGLIKKGSTTVASVKQFYSKKCNENYGYLWVWDSYRDTAPKYDVTVGVFDYADDTSHGRNFYTGTKQQEFWSEGTATVKDCTSGIGTLRPVGTPQPYQAFSEKRC